MSGERTFKVKIVGNSTDAQRALGAVGRDASRLGRQTSTLGAKLARVAKVGLVALAAAAVGGAYALGKFVVGSIQAAKEAVVIDAKLGNVVKSMGLFGNQTEAVTARLIDYASAVQKEIAVSDESIKVVQTKLLTFKELAKSAGIAGAAFDRTTVAAFNMAANGFGSAESNAIQLGKAMNDPIKGITALSRAGVQFTDQQKDQIKTMVESGNVTGAQNLILKELGKQFDGAAAAGASFGDKIGVAWDDVKEAVGRVLLPYLERLGDYVIKTLLPSFEVWWKEAGPKLSESISNLAKWIEGKAIPALIDLWKQFQENVLPALKEWKEYIDKDVAPVIGKLSETIGLLAEKFGKLSGDTEESKSTFNVLLFAVDQASQAMQKIGLGMTLLNEAIDSIGDWALMFWNFARSANDALMTFLATIRVLPGNVVSILGAVVTKFREAGGTAVVAMRDALIGAWPVVNGWLGGMPGRVFAAIGNLAAPVIGRGREAMSGLFDGIRDRWQSVSAWLGGSPGRIVGAVGGLGSALIGRGRDAIAGMASGVQDRFESLRAWFNALPGRVKDAIGDLGSKLYGAGRELINGMKNGVVDAVSGLIEAVKNAIGNAIQAAKDKLKIRSPSRVFMDIGSNAMQGMAKGVTEAAPFAARASTDAAQSVISAASTTSVSGGSSGGRGGLNITINAGLGTDPRELGRVVVDAIKAHERSSGPVFASA